MQSQEPDQEKSQGELSRRRFLKQAGITAGAAALACGGLTAIGTYAPPVGYPEMDGGSAAARRVLVAYATARGSTGEVARAIVETLTERGFSVDLRPTAKPIDPGGYEAVIVGSAIRMGKWLPDAVRFVTDHRDTLSRVPTSYFTVCMSLTRGTEEARQKAHTFIEPVRQVLEPVSEGWFAGKYDPANCALWERLALSGRSMLEGDFRDWDAIKAWAGQVL